MVGCTRATEMEMLLNLLAWMKVGVDFLASLVENIAFCWPTTSSILRKIKIITK